MPIPTDAQIREQIAAAIQIAAPKAIVFPFWVIGFNETDWPGALISPNDEKRVHGYVIGRRETDGFKRGNGCVRRTYGYFILGMHYYSGGPVTNNSEKLFSAEVDAITDKFDKPELLNSILARVQPLKLECFMRTLGQQVHISRGTLFLSPCDSP
jgi:hypothetical protein